MTPQEIYDGVKAHLRAQGVRCELSAGKYSRCIYRGPRGLKCAIGGILPDTLYHPDMDRNSESVDQMMENRPDIKEYFGWKNKKLLSKLQDIHDDHIPDEWKWRLEELARDRGLTP